MFWKHITCRLPFQQSPETPNRVCWPSQEEAPVFSPSPPSHLAPCPLDSSGGHGKIDGRVEASYHNCRPPGSGCAGDPSVASQAALDKFSFLGVTEEAS